MACCLQNHSYTTTLTNLPPYEAWFGHNPIYFSSLNIWMSHFCPCTWWKRTNLNIKLNNCILVKYGESHGIKCYRLFDLATNKLSFNRNVIFHENAIIFCTKASTSMMNPTTLDVYVFYDLDAILFVAPLVQGQVPIPNVLFPNSPPLTPISLTLFIKRTLKYIVDPPFPPHSHLWIFY